MKTEEWDEIYPPNKNFFAKYLPVEGEPQNRDKYLYPKFSRNIEENLFTRTDDTGLPDYSDCQKVKLFLCSRDLKMADKVWVNGEFKILRYFDEGMNCWQYENEDILTSNRGLQPIKILGEISSDAIFVKEGDEFDEDEILQKSETIIMEERLWLYNEEDGYSTELTLEEALEMDLKEDSNIHSYKIGHRYKWKDAEDEAEVTYYYNQYKIQCPTCKQFH